MGSNYSLRGNAGASEVALLAHVPHSSRAMPGMLRWCVELDDDELQEELLRVTDHYTDELFDSVLTLGGVMFVNQLSRLVVDPERFRDDEAEVMSANGAGAVYGKNSYGKDLRAAGFDPAEFLRDYFDPYAAAMSSATAQILDRFEHCLIVDCHSFPSYPLAWELKQKSKRPEICIGVDEFHSPGDLVATLMDHMMANGVEAEINVPFEGTYIPMDFYQKDHRVKGLMIEVRRDIYMDESTGQPTAAFPAVKSYLSTLLELAGVWSMSLAAY